MFIGVGKCLKRDAFNEGRASESRRGSKQTCGGANISFGYYFEVSGSFAGAYRGLWPR